jgi:hypothetical protein
MTWYAWVAAASAVAAAGLFVVVAPFTPPKRDPPREPPLERRPVPSKPDDPEDAEAPAVVFDVRPRSPVTFDSPALVLDAAPKITYGDAAPNVGIMPAAYALAPANATSVAVPNSAATVDRAATRPKKFPLCEPSDLRAFANSDIVTMVEPPVSTSNVSCVGAVHRATHYEWPSSKPSTQHQQLMESVIHI